MEFLRRFAGRTFKVEPQGDFLERLQARKMAEERDLARKTAAEKRRQEIMAAEERVRVIAEQRAREEEARKEDLRSKALAESVAPQLLDELAKLLRLEVTDAGSSRKYIKLKGEIYDRKVYDKTPGHSDGAIDGYEYSAVEIAGIEDGSIRIGRSVLSSEQAKSKRAVDSALETAYRHPVRVLQKIYPSPYNPGDSY